MSDRARGSSRGGGGGAGASSGRGGGRGAGGRGGAGGAGGGAGRPSSGNQQGGGSRQQGGAGGKQEEKKKEVILDLAKFVDKKIRVKFQGGREVQGVLKGYDQLMNLVMDEVVEYLPAAGDDATSESKTRELGLTVLRGTALTIINPADGFEQIANPFANAE